MSIYNNVQQAQYNNVQNGQYNNVQNGQYNNVQNGQYNNANRQYYNAQNGMNNYQRVQNTPQQQNPVYMRKPLNYVDQYTGEKIPLQYQQYVQQPRIDRLQRNSNPTQFFNNPEYSTQDLFLQNQIPNQEEAVVKQRIDNEWNIRTQKVTINVDSKARDFKTSDYENFIADNRNELSVQGMWLSSYIFPNNFNINFNQQYANIKTVKLTSATFPNTRSRTAMYIDDTNNYFYISVVMKCPWLSYNFHIDQTTNLFDFQTFAFSVSDMYINLYKFFQEIEKPYGIPRQITDTTVNNYKTSSVDVYPYTYTFGTFTNDGDWSWNGNKIFNVSINQLNNMEFFAITKTPIIFDNGKNYNCSYYIDTVVTNFSNTQSTYDTYIIEHYCTHTYDDPQGRPNLYTTYTISLTHTFPAHITVQLVTFFPNDLQDNTVYILGQIDETTGVITPVENVVQNGLTLSFNRVTFKQLREYTYTIHYELIVHESADISYSRQLDVMYSVGYEFINPAMITGSIDNVTSASETNYFLMNGTLNGQIYYEKPLNNLICAVVDAEWQSENKSHTDTLQGYTTGIQFNSVEIGWQYYIPVGGKVNYLTMSAGILNNINFYTEYDETTHGENTQYYATFVQGVPSILGNSLSHLTQYVTRAIRNYFIANNMDYSTFQWTYTNDLYMSGETVSKISIPYGEYTLDELLTILSQQIIKVKSVKNIITSADGRDYIENVNDNSKIYFFNVVQFQCKLNVTTEYYKNSYLLKFEINPDSITPLQEQIDITIPTADKSAYTYSFTPSTVLYDIVGLHISTYNATGEIILQKFFTLDPFYFHQESEPEISFVKTVKNPEYTRYNYSYNVRGTIQDDELSWLTFFPAPLYMYNRTYVFPVNCSVTITPASEMYVLDGEQHDKFTLFKILPELPEGFTLEGTTIKGSSPIPFESLHYVYFYYYSGVQFKYYQQIKLINAGFMYNYSTVKLLNGYRFKGVQQLRVDSDIIATPYTNISVQLDKSWTELSNETNNHANNIIAIGDGINIGYLTGDIYGTPESTFQMTLSLTGEYNFQYYGYADVGTFTITDPDGVELSSDNAYIQSTSVELYSVDADKFYGDNSFMVYTYNYITDPDNDIPQFVCWMKPIKNQINNFMSYHIFANDVVSTKLLTELHFSYTNSKTLTQTRYLVDYYKPTQVFTMEQTTLPSIRSWTTSEYTEDIINHQYANTIYLDQYSIAENAVIYPLRKLMFGYATSNTIDINLYGFGNDIQFTPSSNELLSRIWYAIPIYVKNELNGYIFSEYYCTNWVTEEVIEGQTCRLYYPKESYSVNPITNVVNRIDPTTTLYANILDMSVALSGDINSSNMELYKYCLYNRCKMDYDVQYYPANLNTTLYNQITVPDTYSNNNLLGVQIAAKVNKIVPIVDEILSEYDYYNFQDFIWLQISVDNYGQFQNIFDPYTNRWYFAKIFFKRCEKRNDVSFNYFECPLYLCKSLNYIQELNGLDVKIYDRYGRLYSDYNSTHYNFSFTLEIEYFIDDIRANGVSSRRPTQDNVTYSEELMTMQRLSGRK